MKKWGIGLTIVGIIFPLLFTFGTSSIYHHQMVQASNHEVTSFTSTFSLIFCFILALLGIGMALQGGYMIYTSKQSHYQN
jgi:hypothetical protein